MNNRFIMLAAAVLTGAVSVFSQDVVKVGKGSYASYTPYSKCKTDAHGGDQSMYMQYRKLFITERPNQAIPTNDWWTDMLKDSQKYSGHLWSYPQYVEAVADGVAVSYPDYWIWNGTEMKPATKPLHLTAKDYAPANATVDIWHDWDFSFVMADGKKQMYVTLAHGMPFTWVEMKGLTPQVEIPAGAQLLDKDGNAFISGDDVDGMLVYESTGVDDRSHALTEKYGIYFPETVIPVYQDGVLTLEGECPYVVVALLNDLTDLAAYKPYALNVPRKTTVDWHYDASAGKMTTTWNVEAENLITHAKGGDVMQGFIPHHYRDVATPQFNFLDGKPNHVTTSMDDMRTRGLSMSYPTPHGRLRLAAGNSFKIDYAFSGMLPYYAIPNNSEFKQEIMDELLVNYANGGGFGDDTYWGGKGLTQMGLYMTFAREMGNEEMFELCRKRMRNALIDWLTWTPGERNKFFARDNRWGAMIGYDTSYDSETFNDHHFHYGYFTYAGALLALVDDDFRVNYGGMLREVAKDYANWDRNDTRYPFFRTFDPWSGHSFAGGLGDGNGNGQESSSEAMQGWGGLYLLGVALGDDEMRDAGIFGWLSEARATAEYWFDRHRDNIWYKDAEFFNDDNVDGFRGPYNSNITCHGVGWWNYFSADQLWNAAIQWMPISPCLDYLSEDLDFVAWDYAENWKRKSIGGWFDASVDYGSLGDASGLGNVVLSYLQRSDPSQALSLFHQMWDNGQSTVKATDTGGISYYIINNHLTYGDIDWQASASIPTARVFVKDDKKTYMAYNPSNADITVSFSDGHTMTAKARQLTVDGQTSVAIDGINPVDNSEPDPRDIIIMQNLALHKACVESSHENVGTVKENATDGDETTRWGSAHNDNEWIYVDLEKVSTIYKIAISWETAYASEYKLEVSNDAQNWTAIGTYSSSGGKEEILANNVQGRYVRLTGLKRATAYGTSLYELKVFGWNVDATDDDLMGMTITADTEVLKQGKASQMTAKGFTLGGQWVDINPTWSTSNGIITSGGKYTPVEEGVGEVFAEYGNIISNRQFYVEEALRATGMNISAASSKIFVGQKTGLTTVVTNQFGGPIHDADVTYDIQLNGEATTAATIDSKGMFSATEMGTYSVTAVCGSLNDDVTIQVVAFADVNIALGKPVSVTSQQNNSAPYITDGNTESRWESVWGVDPQDIIVDLKGLYNVNRIILRWEGAAAKTYDILVSEDGETWTTVVNNYSLVNDKWDMIEHSFTETAARYVRVHGTSRRLNAYGYSLYELEAYGTSRLDEDEEEDESDVPTAVQAISVGISYPARVYTVTGVYVKTLNSASDVIPSGLHIISSESGVLKVLK